MPKFKLGEEVIIKYGKKKGIIKDIVVTKTLYYVKGRRTMYCVNEDSLVRIKKYDKKENKKAK